MGIIDVRNATFSYGRENVFENIDLEINAGEVFCLFGPNGCGKSTLILCMLGVLPLSNGQISLGNRNVRGMKPSEVAKVAAYIPQSHEKPFPYKAIDVVLMGRTAHTATFSPPSPADRKIAEEALEKVGIAEFRDRPYTQLSGGETQLVLVARALAQQTPILIMDEPTAHLDFRNELNFLETIVNLVKDSGLTIIMATHFPNHAFYFEGTGVQSGLALMNNRNISVKGNPLEVLTEENMEHVFNIKSKIISYTWKNETLRQIVPLETF
ncbi:MAG: ABC transporter ATP-binding protein [Dehalococcoidales bacterium]|jgi:iron complex transport system ATP-binding protein|nr:ABC transporter ATP-binding protein [Dehalococcoidales bacterium]MDD4465878.1 ABC transporter ATP-binding protein [Dehalococcoidales bacterium]MDX9804164.1 ABC transporter ATP-binding protein [Dehalococcoidales bacterium]